MKLFKFLKKGKHQNINFIKANDLETWWNENFNESERKRIVSESANLFDDNYDSDRTAAITLYLLAGNVMTKFYNKNPDVVIRLLKKAAELSDQPIELFEIYSQLIMLQYKEDEDHKNLDKTIALCKKQIDISAEVLNSLKKGKNSDEEIDYPFHTGYQKLAEIKYQQGQKEEALNLIEEAKKDNWSGNWDHLLSKLN